MAPHSVSRLRIALSLSPECAQQYSEQCSRLFHRELRKLLARVLMRAAPAGLSIKLNTPLVVKLGDIPGAVFDRTFCRRLEGELEQVLRAHLVQVRDQWRWESLSASRARLAQQLLSFGESPDDWIARQLTYGSEHWEPVVAGYALSPAGVRLEHRLRQETVAALCRQWAPAYPAEITGAEGSLWFCALHYFIGHPELPPPEPPSVGDITGSVPEFSHWIRGGEGTSQSRQQLLALFSLPVTSGLLTAPLVRWLSSLWLSTEVVEHIRPVLPVGRVTQWHQLLTRRGGGTQRYNTGGKGPPP